MKVNDESESSVELSFFPKIKNVDMLIKLK